MYLSMVYAFGGVILATGAIPVLGIPMKLFTWIGLLLIAIGTGGIKPCVSAFGGDQFKLPEQIKGFAMFFQLFYAAINAGSLLSTFFTPILRENVECFGENDCYSLAFGVPALLMVIAIVIFFSGRHLYAIEEPTGRLKNIFKCIFYGIYKRIKVGNEDPHDHWLDFAAPRYGVRLVQDIKALIKLLVIFIPLPMFWALFDQQGSRWTFQATRMDPRLGSLHIKPDQFQFLNPFLAILFIPLFKYFVYPLLKRCNIRSPLQKMGIGGVMIMSSFLVAGLIEKVQYEEELGPVQPAPDMSNVIIYNGFNCDFHYQLSDEVVISIQRFSEYSVILPKDDILRLEWAPIGSHENCKTLQFSIKDTRGGEINSYLLRPPTKEEQVDEETNAVVERLNIEYRRPKSMNPDLSIILVNSTDIDNVVLEMGDHLVHLNFSTSTKTMNEELPAPGIYKVLVNNSTVLGEFNFEFAQSSLILIGAEGENETVRKLFL